MVSKCEYLLVPVYQLYENRLKGNVFFFDLALTMSISMACLHNKEPIGMSGVDLHMEDLVQDITYFNQADSSYAFIINSNGNYFNNVLQMALHIAVRQF